jgi:hypothetical protein
VSRVDHSVVVYATLDAWPDSGLHCRVQLVPDERQRHPLNQNLCDLAVRYFEVCSGIVDGKIGDQFDVVLTIKPRDA